MGRRRTTRPPGRPAKLLNADVQETLVKALRLGVPVTLACQAADIAESTFYNWMQRGYAEHEERALAAIDPDHAEPNDGEQPYLDLFTDVQRARADAAVRNVGVIQKVAQGGSVTEETTRKFRDPETGELVEEKTVKRQAPDWRAAAWYLERSHRGEYQKDAQQVEVTGAGGGPIQVSADAEQLSRSLAEHLAAGVATPAALEAGDDEDEPDVIEADLAD